MAFVHVLSFVSEPLRPFSSSLAVSPSYFPSPGSSLKYTAKGDLIAEYIKKHEK